MAKKSFLKNPKTLIGIVTAAFIALVLPLGLMAIKDTNRTESKASFDYYCKPQGAACVPGTYCCSGFTCQSGICKATCLSNGASCTKTAQCCGGSCSLGKCVTKVCTPDQVICLSKTSAKMCFTDGSGWSNMTCRSCANKTCRL